MIRDSCNVTNTALCGYLHPAAMALATLEAA